jgi:hypothetical protein
VSRRPPLRALAGFGLFVLWLAFLAVFLSGDTYCHDPATGETGIDALDHCVSHHPLGLSLDIEDDWPLWSFVVMPLALGVVWWPWRPWRKPR